MKEKPIANTSPSYSRLTEVIDGMMRHVPFILSIQEKRIQDMAKINACLLGKRLRDPHNMSSKWQCGQGAIYVISDNKNGEFVYVGSSTKKDGKTPFHTISSGLKRKYNYKFSERKINARVDLFTFCPMPNNNGRATFECIEAVEAEKRKVNGPQGNTKSIFVLNWPLILG
jgi:hypothetical protein